MQNSFDQNLLNLILGKIIKILSKSIYKYARLGIDREKRKKNLNQIFTKSNGIMFAHGLKILEIIFS